MMFSPSRLTGYESKIIHIVISDIAASMNDCIIDTRGKFNTGKRSGFAALFIARAAGGRCYRAVHATMATMKDSGGRMDVSRMDSMLAQLRAGAALAAGKPASLSASRIASAGVNEAQGEGQGKAGEAGGVGVDFTSVLKKSLDHVNHTQQHATKLAQDFEMGAPGANLTDAMISLQKANISLQYTLQVRNKIVTAYQDIMNMPV
jgi:flagellar hook-basal body complex protein FliE